MLVFVPPADYLDREAEEACYRLHENALDDPGYRAFLSRLAAPVLSQLPEGARGLDFGCGPEPALAAMFSEAGHEVALYDSFFFPEPDALNRRYDFITASEVVEHLHEPGPVIGQLWSVLRPGGLLGIMTKLLRGREAFAQWHYIRDPTHVCFFSRQTWQWWGKARGVTPSFFGQDVILFRKPGA